ncbi:hypothetical protein JTB14_025846 [Gonioctena quinquepunctata]|nr:hypothetical protein JTB14_025846 [Gonioctena quinquepunctata]
MKCLKINFRASDRWIVCGESAIEIITEREKPYLRVFLASDSESFAPPLGRLSDFNIENGIKDAEIIFEDIGRSMTPSLLTTSSLSKLSNHSVIREEASPESDEIFFNPLTNGGYLANRLRTLNRIHKVEGTSSKSVHQIKANHSPVRNETTIIPDDMDEKLKDLMTTPSTEKEKIKRLFLETHSFRKNLTNKTSIMEMFPRLRDTCGSVEQEFSLMFPSCSSNFEERYLTVMENILSIYTRTTSSSHPLSDCGFSLNIQSFYALLKMGV